jgi:hypothetical protein
MNRRTFVRSAAAFAAATQARPILGANDRINLAVVGVGGRGRDHIEYFSALPDQKIVAVVDVNQEAQERAQAMVRKLQGHAPTAYGDMRTAFESKEIDAVSIATPNHWHALSMIWACEAGKDVYVEKPASHNLYEGRQMIAAARKHGRVVQVGSQSRSIAHKRKAMQMLRDGVIGEVYMARGMCYSAASRSGPRRSSRSPPGWTGISSSVPRRCGRTRRTASPTTGTGSGTPATATSATRACTRWTSAAGVWAWRRTRSRSRPSLPAASSSGRTSRRRPTPSRRRLRTTGKEIVFDVRNLNTGTESQIPLGGSIVGNIFFGSEGFMIVHPTGFQVFMGDEREKTVGREERGGARLGPAAAHAEFLGWRACPRSEEAACRHRRRRGGGGAVPLRQRGLPADAADAA